MGDFDSVFAKFNEKAKRQAAGRRPTSSGGRDEDDEMDELSRRMAELNRAGSQEKPLPAGRPGRGRGRGRSRERDDEGSYWQAPVRQPNGRDRSPDGQRGPSRPPQYDRADYNDYDDDGRGPSRHRNPSADRPPRDLDSAEREEHGRRGRPDHPPAKSARPQGNHARDRDHDRDGDREAPRSCSSDRDPERRRHRDSSCDRSRPGARGHPGERGRVDDRRRPPPRRHDTRDDEEEEDYDVPSSRSQHLDRGHRVNERHQQYRTDHYDDRPRYSRDRRYDGDDSDDEGYESKLERRKREQLQSKIDLLERDLDRYSSRAGDGISTSAREDELERLKREKQLLADKRRVDEESLVRWQRELENKERTVGTTKSASELAREKETAQKHFDRYHYGIDICFLLDCTGSMGSWMRVAGEKVRDVMEIAPEKFPNAVTRIAFVGYRDYGDGDLREEVYDFADADQVDELKRKVLSMKPFGGGDTPEDIAGGLNNATKLNWKSSTRLVIHIADAPCHGTKYHTCRDSHAAGDPSGLVPEDLLRKLCNKSVDYYFVKINALTDQMIAIFEQVYQNSGRSFQVFNIGDNPAEFLPLVIKSVASSISRSEAFKKAPSPTKGLGLY